MQSVPPTLPDPSVLPQAYVVLGYFAALAAGVLVAWINYRKPTKDQAHDMVITGASIADMAPVRKGADALTIIANELTVIRVMMEKQTMENEVRRRVAERLRETE